jgi:hypothetical protein
MNNRKEIIEKYDNVIKDIYIEYNLNCLRGLDGECKIDGKNIYAWYHQATHHFAEKNKDFNFDMNLEDLLFISDEIIYFTANVILYEPCINDPLRDKIEINEGKILYPNYQN